MASLAIVNRPDSLTFVLVDYKSGSAFKDCARLPHTVGMVTDLDDHLVQRALTSLSAELRRREHLLAGPGAKDLEDYWALQSGDPALPAIPRLVLSATIGSTWSVCSPTKWTTRMSPNSVDHPSSGRPGPPSAPPTA